MPNRAAGRLRSGARGSAFGHPLGLMLSLNGPARYHVSALGRLTNSVHLWGKYWMYAWRGGRVLTWIDLGRADSLPVEENGGRISAAVLRISSL